MDFDQIFGSYSAIEQGFKSNARGAKDICAQVFYEWHSKIQEKIEKHRADLKQLSAFDEQLAEEKLEDARREQNARRTEEKSAGSEEAQRWIDRGNILKPKQRKI